MDPGPKATKSGHAYRGIVFQTEHIVYVFAYAEIELFQAS